MPCTNTTPLVGSSRAWCGTETRLSPNFPLFNPPSLNERWPLPALLLWKWYVLFLFLFFSHPPTHLSVYPYAYSSITHLSIYLVSYIYLISTLLNPSLP